MSKKILTVLLCVFGVAGCYSKHVEKIVEPQKEVIYREQPQRDVVVHEHDDASGMHRKVTITE